MIEEYQHPRFRFRLRTTLVVIAILALLLLVVIQQVQIGRMRELINRGANEKDQLTKIIRELRDHLNRHK